MNKRGSQFNFIDKTALLNRPQYGGPSWRRDSRLLQGDGLLSGAFSDIFKSETGESNFKVDVGLDNATLIKLGVLIAAAIILSKRM